jgi:hypothetical protein
MRRRRRCGGPQLTSAPPHPHPPPPSSRPFPTRLTWRRLARVTTERGRAGPQPRSPGPRRVGRPPAAWWSVAICQHATILLWWRCGNPPPARASLQPRGPRRAPWPKHLLTGHCLRGVKQPWAGLGRQPTPTRPGGCRAGRPTTGTRPQVSFPPLDRFPPFQPSRSSAA